jgi:hypothetical protein
VRLVAATQMSGSGRVRDEYTVFAQGTDVQQPGDEFLTVAIDHVTATSSVDLLSTVASSDSDLTVGPRAQMGT